MWKGNNQSNWSRQPGRVNFNNESPSVYPPPHSPHPFPSTVLPPPPPPVLDHSRYIKPKQVPVETLPFVYDPYGGVPRREDKDPYNTTQPPPPPTHNYDLRPTALSFRDVVLSMQSWGAKWPEPTETSVKRWARRALRTDAPIVVKKNRRPANSAPTASLSQRIDEVPTREKEEGNVDGGEEVQKNDGKKLEETFAKKHSNGTALNPQQTLLQS